MIFMSQAVEYELSFVPPLADTSTFCSLFNNFAVCRFTFDDLLFTDQIKK